ncbi:MAG: acyltransferase family protein [Lacipirellulaceae bacterium]
MHDARLPFLDGLRGIAILVVFLHHALYDAYGYVGLPWVGQWPGPATDASFYAVFPLTYGLFGVALFFVISGFCIHSSFESSGDRSWLKFFHRRFFRIYPPYLVAMLVFLFAKPLLAPRWDTPNRVYDVGMHVALTHNLDCHTFFGINSSFWSIAVEAQLYALYPLLAWIAYRWGWGWSIAVAATSEVGVRIGWTFWRLAVEDTPEAIFLARGLVPSPFAFWLCWALGAYLAECWRRDRETPFARWPLTAVLLATLATTLWKPVSEFNFLGYSLVSAVLLDRFLSGRLRAPERGIAGLAWSHLGLLGVVSYSFYLLHQPLGSTAVFQVSNLLAPGGDIHPYAKLAISVAIYPALLGLSYAAYQLVERTSVRAGDALWRALANRTADPAVPESLAETTSRRAA